LNGRLVAASKPVLSHILAFYRHEPVLILFLGTILMALPLTFPFSCRASQQIAERSVELKT
jgi:hypothetical protein